MGKGAGERKAKGRTFMLYIPKSGVMMSLRFRGQSVTRAHVRRLAHRASV